jgi:hypothetical protein
MTDNGLEQQIIDRIDDLEPYEIIGTDLSTLMDYLTGVKRNRRSLNSNKFGTAMNNEILSKMALNKIEMIKFYIKHFAKVYASGGFGPMSEKHAKDRYISEI